MLQPDNWTRDATDEDGGRHMTLTTLRRKRGLVTALLVIVGLVATVAIARAATPAITGSTTSPAGVVEVKVPEAPGPRALDPHHSDATTGAVEADEHDGDQGDHQDVVSPHHAHDGEQIGDQNDQGENDADAHETVAPRTHERTHHDLHSSDQGDQDDRSSDQGGASQHDGGGESNGSSD